MKKNMVKQGLLDQYGKPNDKTPKDWLTSYVDFNVKKEVVEDASEARKRKLSETASAMETSVVEEPNAEVAERKEKKKKKKKDKEGENGESAAAEVATEVVEVFNFIYFHLVDSFNSMN